MHWIVDLNSSEHCKHDFVSKADAISAIGLFNTIWDFLDVTELLKSPFQMKLPDELPSVAEALKYALAANSKDEEDRKNFKQEKTTTNNDCPAVSSV